MDIITSLIIIVGVYFWFFFIDRFLKSCSHYAYIQFLKGTGLDINFLRFNWTTTAFNRNLFLWGTKIKYLNVWFDFGLIASLILLPISIGILFQAFAQNVFSNGIDSKPIIEPVLPGINLPASELGYYSAALLICSIIHELGHALASVQEDVNLISVGAHVIFILPIAYVNINSDKLFSLNPWKRLKILCAGVWHNLVIAFMAYVLYISLPIFFSCFYHINIGVTVTEITNKSPLLGPRGLNTNDVLISIYNCSIKNEDSWYSCLRELHKNKPSFCVSADLVHNLDESIPAKHLGNEILECCHKENIGKICFEYLDPKDSILEFPPYVCLPGRTVVEVATNYCTHHPHTCPKDTFCFKPVLTNSTNLFKIKRSKKDHVIYLGPVGDILKTVTVSSFVPKFSFLTTTVPDVISKFLSYIVVFSLGLAIVNILPCLFMDGQHIVNTVCYIIFSKHLRTTHTNIISAIINVFFTILLLVHCLLVAWGKLYKL